MKISQKDSQTIFEALEFYACDVHENSKLTKKQKDKKIKEIEEAENVMALLSE